MAHLPLLSASVRVCELKVVGFGGGVAMFCSHPTFHFPLMPVDTFVGLHINTEHTRPSSHHDGTAPVETRFGIHSHTAPQCNAMYSITSAV